MARLLESTGGRGRGLLAAFALVSVLAARPARAGESYAELAQRVRGEAESAQADALEAFLAGAPPEADRRPALARLSELIERTAPPLSPEEWWRVEELARESGAVDELLVGRHLVVLAGAAFAEDARARGLVASCDLAYVELRALFGVDPTARARHRYLVFPDPTWYGPFQIRGGLEVRLPWPRREDAAVFEQLVHELTHAFLAELPATHLYAGGFGEGWCDLTPAYVCERLGVLDRRLARRAEEIGEALRGAGRREYLATRLPIDEVVAYAPASALLLELARREEGALDWEPWRRLFRERSAAPRLAHEQWPARMARDCLWAFGESARPVLRRWRFPLDAGTQAELAERLAPRQDARPPSAELARARWSERGERVLSGWQVLGPIRAPEGPVLEFDPLDGANATRAEPLEHEGVRYAWREAPAPDAYGTLRLDELPGGGERHVVYLWKELAADEPPPAALWLASDARARLWLDGEERARVSEPRRVDVFDATLAQGTLRPGPHRVVIALASEGGRSWVHVRAAARSRFQESWAAELAASDAPRRLAAVEFLGSRHEARELARPLLLEALADGSADVREAAVRALSGLRNDAGVVDALLERSKREKRPQLQEALRAALQALLLESLAEVDSLGSLWRARREAFEASWFVEAEDVVGAGRQAGGFYGTNEGAFANLCFGREWGGREGDWLALELRARVGGARTLALRYVQPDREDATVALELRRGERVVWSGTLALPRTASWSDWRWAELRAGELEPGVYTLRVTSTPTSGSVDLDVIGWR